MSFGCHCFDQKTNKIFLRISALAYKKRLKQKLYYTKYVKWPLINIIKCLFFWFDLFLEARAEILKTIRWFFGRNDVTKKTFWNKLTFRQQKALALFGCPVFSGHNFLFSGWTFLNEARSQYPTKCNKFNFPLQGLIHRGMNTRGEN